MTTIKKIWAFIKNYWFIPLLAIIGFVFFKKNETNKIISKRRETYQKEKRVIETTSELKKILKEKEEKRHEEAVVKIKNKYEIKREELEEKLEKESKTNLENPEEENLAKKMSEKFGVKYEE